MLSYKWDLYKLLLVHVMAAPVISISSDSSEESVGSYAIRVILFGAIPTSIPVIPVVPAEVPIVPADPLVAPEVGAVSIISPTRVLDLVDYLSSSDSDPSEDSLPPAPELPLVLPFLFSDDSKADSESEPTKVASRSSSPSGSSSHDTLAPSSEFPLAPVVAPPGIRRRLLTARKRVRPFPARRLAWRRVSHRSLDHHSSPDFNSDSSSSSASSGSSSNTSSGSPSDSLSDSSSVHSSGCDTSGQAYSGPSTRVVSPRLVYPPVITPRYSEAFRRWRSAPLSTPYPLTTSESSLGSSFKRSLDSSSPSSGLSRKRCRSPTALVPSSTHVLRSIAITLADLLPPRKRFRDSYSPEDSGEEHMEIGTTNTKADVDLGIDDGVGAYTDDGIGMAVEIVASDIREDEEEFEAEASAVGTREIAVDALVIGDISESTRGGIPDLEDTVYDIVHYMSEVPLNMITEFETAQRQLEAGQLVASIERASLSDRIRRLGRENLRVRALLSIERDRVDSLHPHMALSQDEFHQIMTITCSKMTHEAIKELINRRVEEALATYEATRVANALEAESQSQNGSDGDNGNGNGGNRNSGNGNPNENDRG
ncbi:hypothetical protein Tco_1044804 [Tanacetum coccineum]|uniref:Uncharacterized protein n=1 Tax=Tanacetum coccineum TaxID=301880 RepID=A0ABQ5GS26_9ASTR